MARNPRQRPIYLDSERHSDFQRIRHGYIERPQDEISSESDEEDLDLILHRAFVQSQQSRENVEGLQADDFDPVRHSDSNSSPPRRAAPGTLKEPGHVESNGQQRDSDGHAKSEATDHEEEDQFLPTFEVPEMLGQKTSYADARELWRLHMVLVETMLPEDLRTKNRVLTQTNWDLLSELESRDQDLLQISTRARELTDKAASLQRSNVRREVEREYLYEVAADLTERLDECEKQRQQLLSNQSNIWAVPSPKDQVHHDQMRSLIDRQNDEINQLQIEVLNKDEEITDLAYFLEMMVQAQNELTFELNELILRDRYVPAEMSDPASSPAPVSVLAPALAPSSPPPSQSHQEADRPTIVLDPVRQILNDAEVQNSATDMHDPPAPTRHHKTTIEVDPANLKKLFDFTQEVKQSPQYIDQGIQIRQRDLDYPPANIGSHAQHSTIVNMGTLIDIEPGFDEPYPPSKKLLDAAAVLLRQSLHCETDISVPLSTSHEKLQLALRQSRDKLIMKYSPEAVNQMLDRYIDELAAGSGSMSGSVSSNIKSVQPSAFVRRNDQDVSGNVSHRPLPLQKPFNSPRREHVEDRSTLWIADRLTESPEQYSFSASIAVKGTSLPVEPQAILGQPADHITRSRPGRGRGDKNGTRFLPRRVITNDSDSTLNTPGLSTSGDSPDSLRDHSTFFPPTPDMRTPSETVDHAVPHGESKTKRVHDGIDRDSLHTLGILPLVRHESESVQFSSIGVPDTSHSSTGSSYDSSTQAFDVSTPVNSRQDTHSIKSPASDDGPTDTGPNYFWVRIGDRYYAIPVSPSYLWTVMKSILPSRQLWWLLIPYLLSFIYFWWRNWLNEQEWYEHNREYIRTELMRDKDRSWQFDDESRLSRLVTMIFDWFYQPLPPGSYA